MSKNNLYKNNFYKINKYQQVHHISENHKNNIICLIILNSKNSNFIKYIKNNIQNNYKQFIFLCLFNDLYLNSDEDRNYKNKYTENIDDIDGYVPYIVYLFNNKNIATIEQAEMGDLSETNDTIYKTIVNVYKKQNKNKIKIVDKTKLDIIENKEIIINPSRLENEEVKETIKVEENNNSTNNNQIEKAEVIVLSDEEYKAKSDVIDNYKKISEIKELDKYLLNQ